MEQFTKNSDLADFSAQARNKKLKTQLKKISYIPGKMELSNSKIKKFLAFYQEEAFLIFQETKTPKKNSYILSRESFSYILGNGNPKKTLAISENETLYFRK